MKKVVIIGAGPAGLTCALNAVKENISVTILERNGEVGKKLLLTGAGRCNYFNEDMSFGHFSSNDEDRLPLVINEENIDKVYKFFNNLGIETKVKNGYMYPYSNRAQTVRNALLEECISKGVVIKYNYEVSEIEYKDSKYIIDKNIECDELVIATGGKSFPKTGSTGDAKKFAESFELGYVPTLPSLVKLNTDVRLDAWMGVRTDAEVSLYVDNKMVKKEVGEIQLTQTGISGICVFNISRGAVVALSRNRKAVVFINFLPFLKFEDCVSYLDNRARNLKGITVHSFLSRILNEKLINVILRVSSVKDTKLYEDLSYEEKVNIAKNLCKFKINITSTGDFDTAEVTAGGVSLLELDLNTFECIRQKGLYFIGECVDADGICGGYNLGFAWISGILAGSYIRSK